MAFVHLHIHSQYSIADATLRIADLCKFAAAQRMGAVALTDHDNMHGAIEFTYTARKEGLKPIYGCCIGIANRPVGEAVLRVHHLTLLAENNTGYQNLIYLVSQANLRAPDNARPRIDLQMLREHAEGLIALSGDLAGEIPNALLRGEIDDAWRAAERYKAIFGPERFFLEVQQSGLDEHAKVAPQLVELGRQLGLECVATNDVHYLRPEDARAHEVLMCIGLGIQARPDDQPMPTSQLDLPDEAEMRRRFAGMEQLCDNTVRIAERCNVTLELEKPMLPRFPVAEGETENALFVRLVHEGLERRFAEFDAKGKTYDRAVYLARLAREIGVIEKMDFPGYFLIVQDFINWAKENGIPVGPGRGSGAGSLVAYVLRITDLDPLPYNLLFERFLNPERVSFPDFDVDFCEERRTEVIRYVGERYGNERVGQIATFGTLKAKGAVRDVGRVLGVPLADVDRIAKLIDVAIQPLDEKHKTVADAVSHEPKLVEEMQRDPAIRKLLETAQLIEGSVRTVGMHAAGVVIGRGPLYTHVPTGKGLGGENVTQFNMTYVEKANLVKFDFLGLSNLTMIQHCIRLINDQRPTGEEPFDIDRVPLDDPKAFDIISRGDTAGIFQCESPGFTRMMTAMKPTEFEDLIAAGALYRPGPLGMGMHTVYIDRKHGRTPVEFDDPKLEPVLKETYGVIVYQEQVMQVAQVLAGFSLGQADNLRRAMGKKKKEEMDKWGEQFKAGAVARGVDAEVADKIFALMAKFAEYGFNKSHSAAYGLITYQTAYLKANYPVEFYAALLTRDKDSTDSIVAYIRQARDSGLQVLPPDVNESQLSFSVAQGRVRFGLGAIKGLGAAAIDVLIEARQTGPFVSLFDLMRRIDNRKVNKGALEALIKAGAMDSFGQPRDVLWGNLERAIEHAKRDQHERQSEQVSLFSLLGSDQTVQRSDHYETPAERWTPRETLAKEKEVLGFYVSGHPLDRYRKEVARLDVRELAQLKSWSHFEENASSFRRPNADPEVAPIRRLSAYAAVVVVSHSERMTRPSVVNGVAREGRRMAVTVLEDRSGQAELVSFENLDELAKQLQPDRLLLVKLAISEDRREAGKVQLRVVQAESLDEKVRAMADLKLIRLPQRRCQPAVLRELVQVLSQHQGSVRVRLAVQVDGVGETVIEAPDLRISLSDELDHRIVQILHGQPSSSRGDPLALAERLAEEQRAFDGAQAELFGDAALAGDDV